MLASPYDYMQMAVDIVGTSPHPANKIAATLVYKDFGGNMRAISATNFWPSAIESAFDHDTKIGNSSGTIHAETACIIKAESTADSSLYITDPPCPNCAKNIAEAGIKALYIDHKGFEKDFAARRGDEFRAMSMRIFEHAGVSVYEIRRKDQTITPVLEIPSGYKPISEFPLQVQELDGDTSDFEQSIKKLQTLYKDEPFAASFAHDPSGKLFLLHARRHPAVGYTHEDDLTKEGKYSFILQPVNRLLMGSKNRGLSLSPDSFFSSRVPTARELVNMVGAGINTLTLGDKDEARDEYALQALNQLTNAHILLAQKLC